MQKYILLFILITTIFFPNTFRVIDENQNPISNAQIFNTKYGTLSDIDGYFYINEDCLDYTISHIGFQKIILNPCNNNSKNIVLNKSSIPNQEITISGDLSKSKLKNTIADIDVFTKTDIINSNKQNLEDILKSSTNINYSGVSSRIRYFQIRGIGEYEQFAGQGGPNYYVGTLIDNFNFSGFGIPISMFDVDQIEIFKGSQSFTFGQNSMAGQIRVNTTRPKPFRESSVSLDIGSFNKKNIHFIHNQPISKNISLRFAASKNTDQGFIYNDYLDNYSNNRDELISNFKLSWNKSYNTNHNLNILLNILDYNLDNNYDRWSATNFNNFNDFTSYSDFNGLPDNESLDALNGQSQSIDIKYKKGYSQYIVTLASDNINLNHSYDSDWTTNNFPYFQVETRKRKNKSLEAKILSSFKNNNFTLGFFTKILEEKDSANGFIFDLLNYTYVSSFTSNYTINYLSFYLQNSYKICKNSYLTFNIRQDNYKNTYQSESIVSDWYGTDYDPIYSELYNKNEKILSARIGLKLNKFYFTISRGHKAGGFNQNPYISESNRLYTPEYSNSLELGYKSTIQALSLDLNFFYMNRENLHVNIAEQADLDNPSSFYFFTSNIKKGINKGADLNASFKLNKNNNLFINLGFLYTQRDEFSYSNAENSTITINKREQARAPRYTINMGLESYLTSKIFMRIEALAKDRYYYFDNENEISKTYQLINLNTRYQFNDKLSINFSIKNMLNEKYSIHGFYFSLDGYTPAQLYEAPGDPRSYEIKLDYKF